MKLMRCPVNGLRPIQEFAYGGTIHPTPDPGASTDREWADYVFCRSGEPGLKKEWWYHIASGTWFIAERDTVTDEIVQTYLFDGE
ncbi:MAG TPA: sarcosine oxidase subunit delta [Terriglobia bacterium]|nr:sarcosine oxidase subunit delta [Terriglobia bacterium]